MTGKPTEYVKENSTALDAAITQLEALAQKYNAALEEMSKEGQAFKAVKSGATTDEEKIGLAVDYNLRCDIVVVGCTSLRGLVRFVQEGLCAFKIILFTAAACKNAKAKNEGEKKT